MRILTAALLLCASCLTAAASGYDKLPEAKALAVSPRHPDSVRGLTYAQPNELAASVRAREQCQANAAPNESCEVVRLDDLHITTGAEMLSRVPDRHPLFLWRYQRSASVVYLAGSIHILKPSLYPLPEQFDDAFRRSNYLVLEVNVSSMSTDEIQRHTRTHALLPKGQTLADVLPVPLENRLERHLAAFGMTTAMIASAKPAMAMNQIVVSRLLTLGYLPDSGLESYFLSRLSGQQILQLETLEQQLALLFDQPMATQVQLLAETLDQEDAIEPLLADMLVAWMSGQDERFLELFKAESGDSPLAVAFLHQLLDERNRTMADAVEAYLNGADGAAPKTYFVLVGAAHLVGEHGVVSLLAQDGIPGQRILSNQPIPLEEAPP